MSATSGDGFRGGGDPAASPSPDSPVLRAFLEHFGLRARGAPDAVLTDVVTAFARIPYENLTKIIRLEEAGAPARARRAPAEVIADHVRAGTGGTCFSLAATLLHLLRSLGWRAEPVLADRHYGADTHCAVLVWLEGRPHLLDPGYLLVRPIALDGERTLRVPTSFNDLVLVRNEGGTLDLFTETGGQRNHRLTFKLEPADPDAFVRAWEASFAWDGMRYPVVTGVRNGLHVYLQKNRLQRRGRALVERLELTREETARSISGEFGMDPAWVARALDVLRRHGEPGA